MNELDSNSENKNYTIKEGCDDLNKNKYYFNNNKYIMFEKISEFLIKTEDFYVSPLNYYRMDIIKLQNNSMLLIINLHVNEKIDRNKKIDIAISMYLQYHEYYRTCLVMPSILILGDFNEGKNINDDENNLSLIIQKMFKILNIKHFKNEIIDFYNNINNKIGSNKKCHLDILYSDNMELKIHSYLNNSTFIDIYSNKFIIDISSHYPIYFNCKIKSNNTQFFKYIKKLEYENTSSIIDKFINDVISNRLLEVNIKIQKFLYNLNYINFSYFFLNLTNYFHDSTSPWKFDEDENKQKKSFEFYSKKIDIIIKQTNIQDVKKIMEMNQKKTMEMDQKTIMEIKEFFNNNVYKIIEASYITLLYLSFIEDKKNNTLNLLLNKFLSSRININNYVDEYRELFIKQRGIIMEEIFHGGNGFKHKYEKYKNKYLKIKLTNIS